MEYVYAAMILNKAGQAVDEASIKRVLEAAGVKPDTAKIKALVSSLQGVDIEKVIKEAPVAAAAPAAAKTEQKGKEEKKPEEEKKSEEQAAAGLSALFG